MKHTSYDTIHKVIHVNTDKEELEQIARWLNGLNGNWMPEAIDKAKQKAIELLEIARDMHKEELIQYNEDIKDIQRHI